MKVFLSLVMMAFLISNFGCRKTQKIIKVFSEEGVLLEQYEVNKDSLRHGTYIGFYESGDTFEIAQYTHGKLDGQRRIYHENNQLEILENYVQDSLHGGYKTYYVSGKLKRQMNFEENEIVGKIKVFYENGQLKEEVSMQNNMENGPFIEYHENGQKAWEGTYQNGENEIGLLVQYAENGDTIRKLQCDERYICRTFYRNENYPQQEESEE
jgi:antitoxin component YwqK of YwqJK toxin-antitoxin module